MSRFALHRLGRLYAPLVHRSGGADVGPALPTTDLLARWSAADAVESGGDRHVLA